MDECTATQNYGSLFVKDFAHITVSLLTFFNNTASTSGPTMSLYANKIGILFPPFSFSSLCFLFSFPPAPLVLFVSFIITFWVDFLLELANSYVTSNQAPEAILSTSAQIFLITNSTFM